MLSVPQCMLKEKRLCHLHLEDRRKDSYCEVNAGIANMAASGMANASFRGDQRRGPAQSRPGGRPNNFNPSRQVNTINANASMPKRNGAAAHPTTTHPSAQQMVAQTTNSACASDGSNLYQDPRYIAGIMHMVGCRVQVDVTNGKSYEGILSTISPDCDLVVKQATLLRKDDAMLPSGEAVKTMVFNRMDYISFRASNLDLKGDSFTDSSIIRANGQSSNPGVLKELEPWDGGSDDVTDDPLAVQLDDPDAIGWAAEEMFHTNETAFNVPSTYKESLEGYTTPMPTFKTPEEARRAEKLAAEHARSIETQDGYIERLEKENNPSIDEETKFSSVIRPGEAEPSSNSGRYVPPNRRQHLPDQAQRGPAPAPPLASAQQPLPQRERRADRDRGDRGQDGRGDRGWERNPQPRAQHSVPGPYGPPSHGPPSERLNGGDVRERRPEPSGRGGFTARPMNHVGQGIPPQRYPHPNQHIPPQLVHAPAPPTMPPSAPQVQINRGNPPTSVAAAPAVPVTPNTPSSHPSKKAEARTLSPQATAPQGPATAPGPDKKSPREKDRQEKQVANLKHFADNFNVKLPEEDKKEERVLQQDRTQQERRADPDHEQSQAPAEESPGVTAVSQGVTAVSQGVTTTPQGTPTAPQGATATTSQGVTAATPQGATAASAPQGATAASAPQGAAPNVPQGVAATPVSSRGPPAQSPGAAAPAQGASAGSGDQPSVPTSSSILNPLAMEFKPRQPPQPAMVPVPTPTPSATPPAQPRQSPGMLSQSHGAPTLVPMQHPYNPNAPYQLMHKMVPMGAGQQPQQQATKPYQQQPKRAVVSVDQAAVVGLAAHTTGQPLQLAAQGAAMQQPSYVYQLPPSQVLQQGGQGYPVQMRMVQSHLPQGAGMEHGQGASNQQTHMPQQFLMTQQPMPAHMPAQALTQTMAQPAHTHHHPQHTHHHPSHMSHQGHPSLPPSTQQQSNPHPSASPVQHLAGPAPTGPQLNHTQGAPPTSGTPQPQLTYGHQIPMLPPQGGAHAMSTHSGAQGHNTLHFNVMQQQQHHQMQQAGVSFSQAGGTASGAPAPAHLQHSSHINQTMNVVVMPQPPPQAINQAPLNPPHPHHAQATAQFQQQLQGAANQLHGGVGPNQHLLQGNVPGGGANLGMAQYTFPMQPGIQGSHNHSHVHQPPHTLAHHTHHYQGQ